MDGKLGLSRYETALSLLSPGASVRVKDIEITNLVLGCFIHCKVSLHPLEVGLSGLRGALNIGLLDLLLQAAQEHIKALDVFLNNVELDKATVLLEDVGCSIRVLVTLHLLALVPDEVHLIVVLRVLDSDLAEEGIDRHKDCLLYTSPSPRDRG